MRVNAYAAPAAGEPLAATTIERREVGAHDVLIAIEWAGICHSDIHTVNGDWGPQPFPVVPGHEIVGTVTEVGPDVSTHRVVDPAAATPLLCAGITTYSPLKHWKAGPGTKVAVVGLGGLGHMAVKIAHAMGAEVTVLSQSLKKQEDGLRLGADHYFATSDPDTFEALAESFDLVINTVSAKIDVNAYLGLLAVNGTLVNVGAPPEPLPVNAFSLIGGRRSFAGSMIGGIAETQEMLDFCAEHGIVAEIEVIRADQIDAAYERMLRSDVRYRFVVDNATLGG